MTGRSVDVEGLLCRAPFVSMDFDPFGDVQACCANTFFPLGNVGDATIDEIWRGPRAEALRAAIAAGDLTLGCTICRHRVEHDEAERPYEGYRFPLVADGADIWPYQLSFALSNTCNLACAMCGADRSSRIRAQRAHLPALAQPYGDAFFEQIVPYLLRCERVDLVGGEPFLVRAHHRLWDLMSELGVSPRLGITTNGTVWNPRVEEVLDRFDSDIRISIDGMSRSVFEAVRIGADHAEVMANFERFLAYTRARGTVLTINWSFVRDNWFELAEMMLWAESRGVVVRVMTVIEPEHGVQRLPDEELGIVAAALERQDREIATQLDANLGEWKRQLSMVRAEIDRRRLGAPTAAYMEPPDPRHAQNVVRSMLSLSSESPDGDGADHRTVASLDVLRWSAGPRPVDAPRVVLGEVRARDDGTITSSSLRSLLPDDDGSAPPATLLALLHVLEEAIGGALWLLEEEIDDGQVAHTLLLGPAQRDKTGVVLRTRAWREGGEIVVLIARDDWFAARRGPVAASTPVLLAVPGRGD